MVRQHTGSSLATMVADIAFHSHFKRSWLRLNGDQRHKEAVLQCIQYLNARDWSGLAQRGLRVKKLAGGRGSDIMEARINDGDRLLFTRGPRDRLLLLTIAKHDAVNEKKNTYQRRTQCDQDEDNSDWVREFITSVDTQGVEVYSSEAEATCMDFWQNSYNNALFQTPRNYCPPAHIWHSTAAMDKWAREPMADFDLLLDEAQRNAIEQTRPTVLKGGAGSGKTTILLHCLLRHRQRFPQHNLIYLTHLSRLRDSAAQMWEEGASHRGEFAENNDGLGETRFVTFLQLCESLLPRGEPMSSHFLFSRTQFLLWFRNHQQKRTHKDKCTLSGETVWAEVQGVIKGRHTTETLGSALIPEASYLGRHSGLSLLNSPQERQQVWKVAQAYQKHLTTANTCDINDLTRRVWTALPLDGGLPLDGKLPHFQALFCDEVQDLTGTQIGLLHALASRQQSVPRMVFAGDSHQNIYPSGFRWHNIGSLFEGDFQNCVLSRNFRNTMPIQRLGHAIVNRLKRRLMQPFVVRGQYEWEMMDECHTEEEGTLPVRMQMPQEVLLQHLQGRTDLNLTLLTRDEATREFLREQLSRSSVEISTVEEFKGLEADGVLLWRFFRESAFWSQVCQDTTVDCDAFTADTECNRLLVAITRARHRLIVYDSDEDATPWVGSYLGHSGQSLLVLENLDWLARERDSPTTAEDWCHRAQNHERADGFRLAAEAFERANRLEDAKRCHARDRMERGEWADATYLWRELGYWQEMLTCAGEANNTYLQEEARAEIAERAQQWAIAAAHWESLQNPRRASKALCHINEFERACRLLDPRDDGEARTVILVRWLQQALRMTVTSRSLGKVSSAPP